MTSGSRKALWSDDEDDSFGWKNDNDFLSTPSQPPPSNTNPQLSMQSIISSSNNIIRNSTGPQPPTDSTTNNPAPKITSGFFWNQCFIQCSNCKKKVCPGWNGYGEDLEKAIIWHAKQQHNIGEAEVKDWEKNIIFHTCMLCQDEVRFMTNNIINHMNEVHEIPLKQYEEQFAAKLNSKFSQLSSDEAMPMSIAEAKARTNKLREDIANTQRNAQIKVASKSGVPPTMRPISSAGGGGGGAPQKITGFFWNQCYIRCHSCKKKVSQGWNGYGDNLESAINWHVKQQHKNMSTAEEVENWDKTIMCHTCFICEEEIKFMTNKIISHLNEKHDMALKQYEERFSSELDVIFTELSVDEAMPKFIMQAKMQSKAALESLEDSNNSNNAGKPNAEKRPPEKRPMNPSNNTSNQGGAGQQNILQKKIKQEKPDPPPPKRSPERNHQPPRVRSPEAGSIPPGMTNGSVKNLMKYDMLPIPKEIKDEIGTQSDSKPISIRMPCDDYKEVTIRYLQCNRCEYATASKERMTQHVTSNHSKPGHSKCEHCSFTSSNKAYVLQHQKAVHNLSKEFKCEECERSFTQKSSLNLHMKAVHEAVKEFKCNQCNFQTVVKTNLTKHMTEVHNNLKSFTCLQCDYATAYRAELVRHVNAMHNKQKRG